MQRMQYKRRVAGKTSSLSDERKRLLEELGVRWEVAKRKKLLQKPAVKPQEKTDEHGRMIPPAWSEKLWKTRFEELKRYVEEHRHCNVNYKEPLYEWVKGQRRSYVNREKGKKSCLSEERQKLLEELGFQWHSDVGEQRAWKRKFEELRKFHSEHGHCLIPCNHPVLGQWVNNQRRANRMREMGEESAFLTDERKKQLDDLGFVWYIESGRQDGCLLLKDASGWFLSKDLGSQTLTSFLPA